MFTLDLTVRNSVAVNACNLGERKKLERAKSDEEHRRFAIPSRWCWAPFGFVVMFKVRRRLELAGKNGGKMWCGRNVISMKEIILLSQLSHPNIVQYYGSELGADKLSVYLEYVSGGSIRNLLQEYGAFREPVIQNYTRQILYGLAYLHGRNTVHRDIKGANILVDSNGEIKLADFGMAKHRDSLARPTALQLLDHPFVRDQVTTRAANANLTKEAFPYNRDGSRTPQTALELHSSGRNTYFCNGGHVVTSALMSPRYSSTL
ncbi:hypothetical protein RHGRI_029658 [Rhododendron griersonianum]|uniref:Protein kinase domain-containing protein n=1 Tax=Rhododendron griersonianum TaxID=479676 RepID=A0AAV6INE9_9ERIC|nr:hypothetical protein RHGRI_029658 [Rhododendron griersonianum]